MELVGGEEGKEGRGGRGGEGREGKGGERRGERGGKGGEGGEGREGDLCVRMFFIYSLATSYLLYHFYPRVGVQPAEEAGEWWVWLGEEGCQTRKLWDF